MNIIFVTKISTWELVTKTGKLKKKHNYFNETYSKCCLNVDVSMHCVLYEIRYSLLYKSLHASFPRRCQIETVHIKLKFKPNAKSVCVTSMKIT